MTGDQNHKIACKILFKTSLISSVTSRLLVKMYMKFIYFFYEFISSESQMMRNRRL